MDTQLLITFTKASKLNRTLDEIINCYTLAFNKIYILQDEDNLKELICSYNIDISKELIGDIPKNTISVHRKKETNSMFTINALNYLISLLNDGKVDSKFEVPWENYSNCILVTNGDELKKIKTKLYSVKSFN